MGHSTPELRVHMRLKDLLFDKLNPTIPKPPHHEAVGSRVNATRLADRPDVQIIQLAHSRLAELILLPID